MDANVWGKLPAELFGKIFNCFSLRIAAQKCGLSKKVHTTWLRRRPNAIFDRSFSTTPAQRRQGLQNVLTVMALLGRDSITEFKFVASEALDTSDPLKFESDIHAIIGVLVTDRLPKLERLTLSLVDIGWGRHSLSKRRLDSFQSVKFLSLCGFQFTSGSSFYFDRFAKLQVLELTNVSVPDGCVRYKVVFRCPKLTDLILDQFCYCDTNANMPLSVYVGAPMLTKFHIFSLSDVSLSLVAPRLKNVVLDRVGRWGKIAHDSVQRIVEHFSTALEELVIDFYRINELLTWHGLEAVPTFFNLKRLCIFYVPASCKARFKIIVEKLLQLSPKIECLEFELVERPVEIEDDVPLGAFAPDLEEVAFLAELNALPRASASASIKFISRWG